MRRGKGLEGGLSTSLVFVIQSSSPSNVMLGGTEPNFGRLHRFLHM